MRKKEWLDWLTAKSSINFYFWRWLTNQVQQGCEIWVRTLTHCSLTEGAGQWCTHVTQIQELMRQRAVLLQWMCHVYSSVEICACSLNCRTMSKDAKFLAAVPLLCPSTVFLKEKRDGWVLYLEICPDQSFRVCTAHFTLDCTEDKLLHNSECLN